MADRVKEILAGTASDNPGTMANLYRMLMAGRLGGTGKMVMLPVDQGFEHGPARSFAPNPAGYDPALPLPARPGRGLQRLRGAAGLPRGRRRRVRRPDPAHPQAQQLATACTRGPTPARAVTGGVEDALRLGCSAIGYTIYPGSAERNTMYEELRELALEAKAAGLRRGRVVVPARLRASARTARRPST